MKTKNLLTISLINPLTVIIFLAFFFAKIFNLIDWSWWWVFSPLWLPTAICIGILILVAIIYLTLLLIITIWK